MNDSILGVNSVSNDASTKATNFLAIDSTGIMVADLSTNTGITPSTADGRNVFIDSDSVDIRDGQDVLAYFGEKTRVGRDNSSGIEITGNSLIGYGDLNKEFFNFTDSTTTYSTQYSPKIVDFKYLGDIPYGSQTGLGNSINHELNSGTRIKISIILYRVKPPAYIGEVVVTRVTRNVTVGTSESVTVAITDTYADPNVTYNLQIHYDGVKTFDGIRLNSAPQSVSDDDPASFRFLSVVASYYVESLASSYKIGQDLTSTGAFSFAEGLENTASGNFSHVEGYKNTASNSAAHAEGKETVAQGYCSHTEGWSTEAVAYAHAEGSETKAYGAASHAEGSNTIAYGDCSHASGYGTLAGVDGQTAIGTFNAEVDDCLFAIGNGESDDARSNAFTVDKSGNVTAAGSLKLGGSLALAGHTGDYSTVGSIISKSGGDEYTSDLSTAADTWKALASISLNAGRWIIVARARFDPTSSGAHYSSINISTTSASDMSRDKRYGATTNTNQHSTCIFYNVTSDNTTIYLNGSASAAGKWIRTSASALYLGAMRIV